MILATVMVIALLSVQFSRAPVKTSVVKDTVGIQYPAKVKAIIDNKCFGCHNPDAKNQEAKDALNFVNLPTLKKSQQISKLNDIAEVTQKGEMPPKKFIEKKPEAKLSDAESKLLVDWASGASESLMK
ncbi:MAG: heme-binding domain-containing protein [Bacteroidales bacterium]|nr:heme-binding domain-containing protein [Bacteroidales bacterium]